MEDNYNYYTSTHRSTAMRTFYVALNRLGGPRVTYLPANKPLGKLATYVKSFTLIVPEHRSEALIGRLFGSNHVKHGIKHLCESGKELRPLNADAMVRPVCQVMTNQKSSVASKKSTNNHSHSNNNRNHSHNKRVPSTGPAALIDRLSQNAGRSNANNCTSADECPKKKKKNHGRSGANAGKATGNARAGGSAVVGVVDTLELKVKQKQTKHAKRVNKNSKKSLPETTTTAATSVIVTTTLATTTTKASRPSNAGNNNNRFQSVSPKRWPALDDATTGGHFDDALNDSLAAIPILSNGHIALNDDDDDISNSENIDYDD